MMNLTSFIDKKKLSKILREFVTQLDDERRRVSDAIAALDSVERASEARSTLMSSVGTAHQYLNRVIAKKSLFARPAKSPSASGSGDAETAALLLAEIEKDFSAILSSLDKELRVVCDPDTLVAYTRFLRTLVSVGKPLFQDRRKANLVLQKHRSLTQGFHLTDITLLREFTDEEYLDQNKDVLESVKNAGFFDGFEHFLSFGAREVTDGQRFLSVAHRRRCQKKAAFNEFLALVKRSGIVDQNWYTGNYGATGCAVEHFVSVGMFEGFRPNFYFDWQWLESNHPQFSGQPDKLVNYYLTDGEKNGIKPSLIFDPLWYAQTYSVDVQQESALGHFVQAGRGLRYAPNKCINYQYYVDENPDVLASGIDPFEHYFECGWKEGRRPSQDFDTEFYTAVHLHGYRKISPVLHYLEIGQEKCLPVNASGANEIQLARSAIKDVKAEIPRSVKFFANPGPDFEDAEPVPAKAKARARNIAFYLPQFHAFDENDTWWGKGFTEWRNVMRGLPRFEGHYQPRIPRDLGFYDLTNEEVLVRQAELAMRNGISGFCFYYYWFNGKRLMDKPLDIYANSTQIESDFCIMWANENWTRTWDGMEKNVLIQQDYFLEDEDAFIADTTRYFENSRYITVDGRPLFILYRPGLVTGGTETFARWREKWRRSGFDPLLFMVQGFGDDDPTEFDFDGAVEFPPHKLCDKLPNINNDLNIYDGDYKGHVVSYDDVLEKSLALEVPDFPLIKTVVPHWDNDARREGRGFTIQGSTPQKYERWLDGAVDYAVRQPVGGEDSSFVFVNAWNEWAEGAYLEPDVHYGHAYLNANRRAIYGGHSGKSQMDIVLVGHDAHKHGAQLLLLNIATTLARQFGLNVKILLLNGGALESRYREVAEVEILDKAASIDSIDFIRNSNSRIAITNTCVSGAVVPALKKVGFKVVSLIHELPRIIQEYDLLEEVENITRHSDTVVFPAEIVKHGFMGFGDEQIGNALIRPQGSYQEIDVIEGAKASVCAELGIPENSKIALNVGFADLRKGFDIFLQAAKLCADQDKKVHFVWLGGIAPELKRWVYEDYKDLANLHCVGFSDDVASYYNACDTLFLSSREDPYPTVVLEAMCLGKPVVCIKRATGFDQLMGEYGHLVDGNDIQSTVDLLYRTANTSIEYENQRRIDYFNEHCRFDDYCWDLLSLLKPALKKVSVVVPNYNYAEHMPDRIQSVFNQNYPIFELIVLDDKSPDNSVEVINDYLASTGRKASVVENKVNSGNTFKQWMKGLELCRGELIWIAEADDLSEPEFLSCTVNSFGESTLFAFTDSAQIDENGNDISGSYSYYYKEINQQLFEGSFSMPGDEFCRSAMAVKNPVLNVSSVVWDRQSLYQCLESAYTEVISYRVAGDWRLYIDVLLQNNSFVSYISRPLNIHRRHQSSVTHSLDYHSHLDEIKSIHSYIRSRFDLSVAEVASMDEYINELVLQFGLKDAA